MAIDIEKRFTVDAPVERVWAFLTDLERVAECLRGAAIMGREEDGGWSGTMKVKLGPVSSTYRGTVRFVETDGTAHTAELSAEGRDSRGKGAADMTMRSELTGIDGGTEVHVASTVHVTGVLARMGRGMIEDVSEQLFEQFTGCVRGKLEGGAEGVAATAGVSEPEPGLSERERGAEEPAPGASEPEPGVSEPEPGASEPEPGASERERGADEAAGGEAATTARTPPDALGRPGDEGEALQLGGMGARAVARALGRTVRRPLFWIVVSVIVLAVWAVTG